MGLAGKRGCDGHGVGNSTTEAERRLVVIGSMTALHDRLYSWAMAPTATGTAEAFWARDWHV